MLPTPLRKSRIEGALQSRGRFDLRVFGVVTSTNDVVKRLLERGAGPGLAVIAEGQTAGRGRRGAAWISTPGSGIFLSVAVEKPAPDRAPLLAGAAGVAIADAVRAATGEEPALKWPNDLWVRERKVGGVLVEMPGGAPPRAVVGFGITLAAPAVLPAGIGPGAPAGLSEVIGRIVPREALAAALLDALDLTLRLARSDAAELRRRYRALDALTGRDVAAETAGVTLTGRVTDVDLIDGIEIELSDGARRRLRPEHTHIVGVKPRT